MHDDGCDSSVTMSGGHFSFPNHAVGELESVHVCIDGHGTRTGTRMIIQLPSRKLENWKTGKLENWKMPSSNLESLMAEMFEKWNQSGYGRGSFHDHQMARVGRMANET